MKNLLAIIENRIRQEPGMLHRAKELFCNKKQDSIATLSTYDDYNIPLKMHIPTTLVSEYIFIQKYIIVILIKIIRTFFLDKLIRKRFCLYYSFMKIDKYI